MCGITGFIGEGDERVLASMTGTLEKRGPDDSGTWVRGEVGLGMTRLAVIDITESGHQPMLSSTGKTAIVFNGEIYNYRELRAGAQRDYRFFSESDTEVILALYEQKGEAAFSDLAGMFAFALYDIENGKVFLVRDRMGKKPLYWGSFDGTILFGSELKSLMRHPKFRREIDPDAVALYLSYEAVPTPHALIKGVRKVEAGGYVEISGRECREKTFWRMPRQAIHASFDEALRGLDERLGAAVRKRLVSDVPLGVFLSGGVDSSAVAYYAQEASDRPVQTFSIGFTDADFDESRYAKLVSERLGTEHHLEILSPAVCLDLIPEVFSYLDEPVADPSILPSYLLSGFTKRHVTVALGGDGADELFAGYPTFQAESLVRAYRAIPSPVRSALIEPLIRALPVRHSYFSLEFKMKKFVDGAHVPATQRHQQWLSSFDAGSLRQVMAVPHAEPGAHIEQFFPKDGRAEHMNDVLWSYMRTYCMDEVMVKVDRASMAQSLEARSPFLDHELVEYVQNLPYKYKFSGMKGKRLLKRLMRGRLPDEILDRKKQGFAVPMGKWLRKELNPLMRDLLSRDALAQTGVFRAEYVERLMREHEAGARDNRKKLWTLMAFQLWHRNWMR